jgi:hypothetical protein
LQFKDVNPDPDPIGERGGKGKRHKVHGDEVRGEGQIAADRQVIQRQTDDDRHNTTRMSESSIQNPESETQSPREFDLETVKEISTSASTRS